MNILPLHYPKVPGAKLTVSFATEPAGLRESARSLALFISERAGS
jgi:hypothetical protein